MHFLKIYSTVVSFYTLKTFRPSSLHCFRDIRVEKTFAEWVIVNVTMKMSYNQKINFGKYDWKSYLLRHINIIIAHKNLILLKQDFSHVAFLQHRVKTKPGESECLYSHGWYLLEVFGLLRNSYRAVLEYGSSAYGIAFAEKANEAESSVILHQKTLCILFQNLSFSKKYNQISMRIWGSLDLPCISLRIKCHHSQIVFRS